MAALYPSLTHKQDCAAAFERVVRPNGAAAQAYDKDNGCDR